MKTSGAIRRGVILLAMSILWGCTHSPPQALGTLEFDRINLPAPAAERIIEIAARDGERVQAGQLLLKLDPSHTQAELAADLADVQRQREVLRELQIGPRAEDVAKARANLASAEAQARSAQAYYRRLMPLAKPGYVSAVDLDRARADAGNAEGQVNAANAALDELLHGSRPEDIAQAKSSLAAAQAQAEAQRVLLGKLDVVAPRAGVVDSIPYKLGDQAPIGSPLAVLLVGDAPYARIYVPERQRANVQIGDSITVHVDGVNHPLHGRVRMIRSEPAFTPYYALTGGDAARLSYIAEVQLDKDAANLPAGLPLHVDLPKPKQ